jgi:hypothetical protein
VEFRASIEKSGAFEGDDVALRGAHTRTLRLSDDLDA